MFNSWSGLTKDEYDMFNSWSGLAKNYKICICCFFAKCTVRTKIKDNNILEWSNIST